MAFYEKIKFNIRPSQPNQFQQNKASSIPNFTASFLDAIEFQHSNDYMKDYLTFREKFGLAQHVKYIVETENQHQEEEKRRRPDYDGTLTCFIRLINSFSKRFMKALLDKNYSAMSDQYKDLLVSLIYENQVNQVKEMSSLLLKKQQLLAQMQDQFSSKILLLHEQVKIARNQVQMLSDQLIEEEKFEELGIDDSIKVKAKQLENLLKIQYQCQYNKNEMIAIFNLRDLISHLEVEQYFNNNRDFMHLYNANELLKRYTQDQVIREMYRQFGHPNKIERRSNFNHFLRRYCSIHNKADYFQYELIQDEELINFYTSNLQDINYIIYKNKLVDRSMDFKVKIFH